MKILLIFKGIVLECMTLFTKMSLKGHEDNDLAPKVNNRNLHGFANVRWLNIIMVLKRIILQRMNGLIPTNANYSISAVLIL